MRSLTSTQSTRHNATIATTTPPQPLFPPQLSQTPKPSSTTQATCIRPPLSSCDIANAIFKNARRASHPPHRLTTLSGFEKVLLKKKKSPRLLENKDTPAIPHNSGVRRQSREGGLITGWTNNRKRGATLKTISTNKKMKGKGKTPTEVEDASTAATKKPPATNPPPTTMLQPGTAGTKYTNWKQDPTKSELARAVEEN